MEKTLRIKAMTLPLLVAVLLSLTGAVEAVWGLLQLAGIAESGHPLYPLTGSFFNPSPYGCFLGMAVPASLALALRRERWLSLTGAAALLLTAAPLAASMSRTGWAAAVGGCLLTCVMTLRHRFSTLSDAGRKKRTLSAVIAACAIIILAVVAAHALYSLKPESARGRVLIWKVSAMALADAPLQGVGPDRVAGAYGDAQERYFRESEASGGIDPGEAMVAGAPEYLFNEYLQTGLAFGPLAMTAFILIIGLSLWAAIRGGERGMAGCMAAFAIISLASYPLRFGLFLAALPLLAAGCLAGGWTRRRWLKMSAIAAALLPLGAMCTVLAVSPASDRRAHQLFQTGLALHRAGRLAQSDSLMQATLRVSSDPMPLNILGKNSQARKDYKAAEAYFRRASLRKPSALYPRYLLMLLYVEAGRESEALREAGRILAMPTKVGSPAEDDIRRRAREVIIDWEDSHPLPDMSSR